jgi:hypothetical protein
MIGSSSDSPNLYSVLSATLPICIWLGFIVTIAAMFRRQLSAVLSSVYLRIRSGASFKAFQIELGSLPTIHQNDATNIVASRPFNSADKAISKEREAEYRRTRQIEIVHRISPSEVDGQLYDIVVYAIAHRDASLLGLQRVDYYLARPWGERVYFSEDRARAFAIRTCAYGPLLCLARLHFNDGEAANVFRYIDFEMGDVIRAPGG